MVRIDVGWYQWYNAVDCLNPVPLSTYSYFTRRHPYYFRVVCASLHLTVFPLNELWRLSSSVSNVVFYLAWVIWCGSILSGMFLLIIEIIFMGLIIEYDIHLSECYLHFWLTWCRAFIMTSSVSSSMLFVWCSFWCFYQRRFRGYFTNYDWH